MYFFYLVYSSILFYCHSFIHYLCVYAFYLFLWVGGGRAAPGRKEMSSEVKVRTARHIIPYTAYVDVIPYMYDL